MLKAIAIVVALLIAAILFAGDETGAADRGSGTLMKRDIEFYSQSAAHGLDGWLSFFADDAAIFPPGERIVTGLPAIREHYVKTGFSPQGLSWKPEGEVVSASKDLGYSYGTWEKPGFGQDGKPVIHRGKYLTVWRKQADGSWKVIADIGNIDPPPSARP